MSKAEDAGFVVRRIGRAYQKRARVGYFTRVSWKKWHENRIPISDALAMKLWAKAVKDAQ